MSECPVCRVPLDYAARERCPSPGCPCYGTRAGSPEMERAAREAVTRPFSRRSLTGAEALDQIADQAVDGGGRMAEARAIGARRAARFQAGPARTMTGYEALIELQRLGIGGIGHEPGPGWPA